MSGAPERSKGDVRIGSDVWIGAEATVLSGVTIGDGAVIGARAVVARDVPPYGIVVGNPARLVRLRFSEDLVGELLAIRWWDFDDARILELLPLLNSSRIEEFVTACKEAAQLLTRRLSSHGSINCNDAPRMAGGHGAAVS